MRQGWNYADLKAALPREQQEPFERLMEEYRRLSLQEAYIMAALRKAGWEVNVP